MSFTGDFGAFSTEGDVFIKSSETYAEEEVERL